LRHANGAEGGQDRRRSRPADRSRHSRYRVADGHALRTARGLAAVRDGLGSRRISVGAIASDQQQHLDLAASSR
jgi:hypothetical protein